MTQVPFKPSSPRPEKVIQATHVGQVIKIGSLDDAPVVEAPQKSANEPSGPDLTLDLPKIAEAAKPPPPLPPPPKVSPSSPRMPAKKLFPRSPRAKDEGNSEQFREPLLYPNISSGFQQFLQGLSDSQIERFQELSTLRPLVHGQPAVGEHTPINGIYVVDGGEIELCRSVDTAEHKFFKLKTGDIIGVVESVLDLHQSLFTARASGFAYIQHIKSDPVRAFEWASDLDGAMRVQEKYLLSISRQLRNRPGARVGESTQSTAKNLNLRSLTLFDSLHSQASGDLLLKVLNEGSIKYSTYESGDTILEAGAPITGPLFLQSGKALVTCMHGDEPLAEVPFLAPQLFGAEDLIEGSPSRFTVRAMNSCCITKLRVRHYDQLRLKHPSHALQAMRVLMTMAIRMLF